MGKFSELEPGSKSQFREWHGGWVPESEVPGGEATGTCLAPATRGARGSTRPRLTWAWTPRSGSRRGSRPGSASQRRRESALGQSSRPPRPPPSSGPPLPAGPRRPRGEEGGGGAPGTEEELQEPGKLNLHNQSRYSINRDRLALQGGTGDLP